MFVGIDEVGTGALAGPVFACAYAADSYPSSLRDSKQLSPAQREALYDILLGAAPHWCFVVAAPAREVRLRRLGSVWETLIRACIQQAHKAGAERILVDGNRGVATKLRYAVLPKADATVQAVMAASVVAKVTRDRLMARLHLRYPRYGWIENQGYGTQAHQAALAEYGPTEEHRYLPWKESHVLSLF